MEINNAERSRAIRSEQSELREKITTDRNRERID